MQNENNNKITVTYRLTTDQYMAACNQHWQYHNQTGATNIAYGSVAILGGIGFFFLEVWIGVLLTILGCILISMTFLRTYWWRQAFEDTSYYDQDMTVGFGLDNITVEAETGNSVLQWSFYESYLETKDFFLLYMNREAGHFSTIPKLILNEQQTKQLSSILSEKLA